MITEKILRRKHIYLPHAQTAIYDSKVKLFLKQGISHQLGRDAVVRFECENSAIDVIINFIMYYEYMTTQYFVRFFFIHLKSRVESFWGVLSWCLTPSILFNFRFDNNLLIVVIWRIFTQRTWSLAEFAKCVSPVVPTLENFQFCPADAAIVANIHSSCWYQHDLLTESIPVTSS
jgi:hypothetical protein